MLFEFNRYSSLLLPGVLQGLIYVALLLARGRREERRADYWLAFLLLLCCLYIANWMLGFAGWYDAHDWHTTFMFYVPWGNQLLIGPGIYFFFRCLTNTSFRLRRRHWWLFLPGILSLLARAAAFGRDIVWWRGWLGRPLPDFYGTKGPYGQYDLPLLGHPAFEWLWIYAFLLLTIRDYGRYRRYIRDHFSDTEPITFGWLRNLLLAITLGLTVVMLIAAIDSLVAPLDYQQFWLGYFSVAVLVYYLSIAGYTAGQRAPVALAFSPDAPPADEDPPAADPATDPELAGWKEKVEHYVARERPYLDPNLTLQDLAGALGTNASVLSRVINQGFGEHFNDFINRRRVEAVKQRLAEPDARRLTLLALAFECGFNSKATFNRAFRKFTGQAPGEYWREEGR